MKCINSRNGLLILFTLILFSLSACSFSLGIEELIQPPKLTTEQLDIYNALLNSTGSNIKLKYPKTGEYRSAFVLYNSENGNYENALVFYEDSTAKTNETAIRFNLLNRSNGDWKSAYDIPGIGTDVERVNFSYLGSDEKINVIIGFSTKLEKTVLVMRYDEGEPFELYRGTYTFMDVIDLNGDGYNELFLVSYNKVDEKSIANVYGTNEQGLYLMSSADLDPAVVEYTNYTVGNLSEDIYGIVLESNLGNNTAGTQLLYIYESRLFNATYNKYSNQLHKLLRYNNTPVYSQDIDKDGILDFPGTSPFPGYENLSRDKQLNAIVWYAYGNLNFESKYYSYYSTRNKFMFIFPGRWQGIVTATSNTEKNEAVFYKYDGQLTDEMHELLRIKIVKTNTENDNSVEQGYTLFNTKGENTYFYKMPSSEEPLILTVSELEKCLWLLD